MINRHNYEEFFLLYVDNELEAEERVAVENFVRQNPDLAKELEVLRQITLSGEDVQFTGKELLYKKENSISLSNHEEYFLLFADIELTEKEVSEVENFVLTHPELQDEFTLLQKVKLQPEPILFTDKQALYRKEKKERRVILLSLARMGAAAAIIGAVYMSFVLFKDKNSIPETVAVTQVPAKKVVERIDSIQAQQPATVNEPEVAPSENNVKKDIDKNVARNLRSEKTLPKKIREIKSEEEKVSDTKTKKVENEIPIEEKSLAIEEKPFPQEDVVKEDTKKDINRDKNSNDSDSKQQDNFFVDQPVAKAEKPLVTHAVYLETDDLEQEKTLYIGSAKINKSKVKGLFKKAAIFLDKKLRGEDN